jgi:hypothetical protein
MSSNESSASRVRRQGGTAFEQRFQAAALNRASVRSHAAPCTPKPVEVKKPDGNMDSKTRFVPKRRVWVHMPGPHRSHSLVMFSQRREFGACHEVRHNRLGCGAILLGWL